MQILVRFAAMLALLIVGCVDLGEPLERGSSILDETINGRSLWYPSGGTFDVVLEENCRRWVDVGIRTKRFNRDSG